MTTLLVAGFPAGVAQGQLPLLCDTLPPKTIQQAIDAAPSGGTVRICLGTYAERLTISKPLTLIGTNGAVLDGASLVGVRYGISLAPDVKEVTIQDLEIRNFKNVADSNDPSSAIVALGSTKDIRITHNKIHDNGWVGVLAAKGEPTRWRIDNNTFTANTFAHVFLQASAKPTIDRNTFNSAPEALILAKARGADVLSNTFSGAGNGAIVVSPRLGAGNDHSKNVTVQGNQISGSWLHGIWALAPKTSTFQGNTFTGSGAGFTIGGNPEETRPIQNSYPRAVETKHTKPVLQAFDGVTVQGHAFTPIHCVALWCKLPNLIGSLLPAARADASAADLPPAPEVGDLLRTLAVAPPIDCVPQITCTADDIAALFQWALTTGMNPLGDAETARDAAYLSACQGQPDSCLRAKFIDSNDTTPAHAWTISVVDPTLGPMQVKFIDVGVRKPGWVRGPHSLADELAQNWQPFVICRAYVGTVALPCATAPRTFDLGLDSTWADVDRDIQESLWRLHLPADGVHASFERVHSPDATLFKITTVIHDSVSPAPPDGTSLTDTPALVDPAKVAYAGRATLECGIIPLPGGTLSDCGDPTLLEQAAPLDLLYCPEPLSSHPLDSHLDPVHEAALEWRWSLNCAAADAASSNWTSFFNGEELANLGAAQKAYFTAPNSAAQAAAEADAESTFAHAAARHLAFTSKNAGLPSTYTTPSLDAFVPAVTTASVPPMPGAATAAIGTTTFIFGGTGSTLDVFTFDSLTRRLQRFNAGDSPARRDMVAIAAGTKILLAGGLERSSPTQAWSVSRDVVEFDPLTGSFTERGTLNLTMHPEDMSGAWDPRSVADCVLGCAYFMDKQGSIERYNPAAPAASAMRMQQTTGAVSVDHAPTMAYGNNKIFWLESTRVVHYNPVADTVSFTFHTFPFAPRDGAGVIAGSQIYLVGGTNATTHEPSDLIMRFNMASPFDVKISATKLPFALDPAGATWDAVNSQAWLFAGETDATEASTQILHVRGSAVTRPDTPAGTARSIITRASNFDHVELTSTTGSPNVKFVSLEILNGTSTWQPATVSGITAFTPIRLKVDVNVTDLEGKTLNERATFYVNDTHATKLDWPVIVDYAGTFYGEVFVEDQDDNLDYDSLYLDPTDKRTFTLPLLDVDPGASTGILDAAFALPPSVEDFVVCTRELWSGRADGTRANIAGTRLAAAGSARRASQCDTFNTTAAIPLGLQTPMSIAVEIRIGPATAAHVEIIQDPYTNLANAADPSATFTYSAAVARGGVPVSAEASSLRLVVELAANMTPLERAEGVWTVMDLVGPRATAYAVEIDDLPLPPTLDETITKMVGTYGTTVLVPAGHLPQGAAAWPIQDKLMTITGLAAHPLVLTIGAGDVAHGVGGWSRRGPTPILTPKPDFVAPSPAGTTAAAVANVLPMVEALNTRGLTTVSTVSAFLAGIALPAHAEGRPATFWDAGYGTLDVSPYLTLPSTSTLIGSSASSIATALEIPVATVTASPAASVLGNAATPTTMSRIASTVTLVRFTIDTPALPQQNLVDFGIVNRDQPGGADFIPLDLDALLAATINSTRLPLEKSGLNATQAASRLADLRSHLQAPDDGQNVTTSIVHYPLFDLLSGDFLYTTYSLLLSDAANATTNTTQQTAAAAAIAQMAPWKLPKAYSFVPDRNANATLPIDTTSCIQLPTAGTEKVIDAAVEVLDAQIKQLRETSKRVPMTEALAEVGLTDFKAGLGTLVRGAEIRPTETCVETQVKALRHLRNVTAVVRAVKEDPYGAWNKTEANQRTWNTTDLGRQIAATAKAAGLVPSQLDANNTLLLDTLLDAIDAGIAELEGNLALARTRFLELHPPAGFPTQETLPARTQNATLGPYVGLARMTSHGVEVRNPLNDALISKRDITIPVASFLWNNPTFTWHETYRYGTPFADAPVMFHIGNEEVFSDIHLDLNETVNLTSADVIVPLEIDPARVFGPELDIVTSLRADVAQLLNDSDDLGFLAGRYEELLTQHDEDLASWQESLECRISPGDCDLEPSQTRILETIAVNDIMALLYSHRDYYIGLTDNEGDLTMPTLYPGSYQLFQPYPYPTWMQLDTDYATVGGAQGFNESDQFPDPVTQLGRQIQETIDGLPRHPSAEPTEPSRRCSLSDIPYENGLTHDTFCIYEVDGQRYGPFNQFALDIHGADLLAAACLGMRSFSENTSTPLGTIGCGLPGLDRDLRADLEGVATLTDCALGRKHANLTSDLYQNCQRFRTAKLAAGYACEADIQCAKYEAYQQLEQDLVNLSHGLHDILATNMDAPIPWLRSPGRLLATNLTAFGYDTATLEAKTDAVNGPDVDAAEIEAAVESVLANIHGVIFDTIDLDTPPNASSYTHEIAEGVVHHITDKVSGVDWTHLDVGATGPVQTEDDRTLVFTTLEGLFKANTSDRRLVSKFVLEAEKLSNQGRDALNMGILKSMSQRAGNLSSVGSMAEQKLNLSVLPHGTPAVPTCLQVEATSGVQAPYFECSQMETVDRSQANLPSGIDAVQLANAVLVRARDIDFADEEEIGEAVERALIESVSIASSSKDVTWYRTENETLAEPAGAVDVLPLGLLTYSVPVPDSEYLQYRLDAELQLQNTGALLISSTKEDLIPQVVKALGLLDLGDLDERVTAQADPQAPITRPFRLISSIQQQVALLGQQPTERLHVEFIGGPTAAQVALTRSSVMPNFEPRPDVSDPDIPEPKGECRSVFCYQSMVTVNPLTHHNVSRTYELNTPGEFGTHSLDIAIVYFPLSSLTEEPVLPQRFGVNNFTIQMKTYIGRGNGEPSGNSWDLSFQSGFRNNTEDWKAFYAIPAIKTKDATFPQGLDLTVTVDGTLVTGTEIVDGLDILSENLGNETKPNWTPVTHCPDEAAPGFPTEDFSGTIRGIYEPTLGQHMFAGSLVHCKENYIRGMQPAHREENYQQGAGMSRSQKTLTDALPYWYGGISREDFTKRGDMVSPRERKVDLLYALDYVMQYRDQSVTWDNPGILGACRDAFGTQLHAIEDAFLGLVDASVYTNLTYALPFLDTGYNPSYHPGNDWDDLKANPPGVHHWLVIDQHDLRDALGASGHLNAVRNLSNLNATQANGTWSYEAKHVITVTETVSAPEAVTRAATPIHGQKMLPVRDTEARPGLIIVDAESFIGENLTMEHVVDVVQGNGITSSAVETVLRASESVLDQVDAQIGDAFAANANAQTFNVTTTIIGGNKTAGSVCSDTIVTRATSFFRCNGNSAEFTLEFDAITGGQAHPCANEAEALLDHVRTSAFAVAAASAPASTDPDAADLLEHIMNEPSARVEPGQYDLAATARAREDNAQAAMLSAALVTCVTTQSSTHVTFGGPLDLTAIANRVEAVASEMQQALEKSAETPDYTAWTGHLANVTEILHPQLALYGEKNHTVEALLRDVAVRAGAVNLSTNPFPLHATVEEWTTKLDHATLTVRDPPTGSAVVDVTYPTPGAKTEELTLVHGHTYKARLEAVDEYDNHIVDEAVFIADGVLPTTTPGQATTLFKNATFPLTWTVQDATSGLRSVVVQREVAGQWVGDTNILPEGQSRATTAVQIDHVLDASAFPDGTLATFRIVVTDWAGNKVESSPPTVVRFDYTLPVATGTITSLTYPTPAGLVVYGPALNSNSDADDAYGLARFEVIYRNLTSNVDHVVQDLTRDGQTSYDPVTTTFTPWPKAEYRLVIRATDRAGNRGQFVSSPVYTQINATIALVIPDLVYQELDYDISVDATLKLAPSAYAGVAVDRLWMNLTKISTWDVVFEEEYDDFTGQVGGWEADDASDIGEYLLNITAKNGRVRTVVQSMQINVTVPDGVVRNLTSSTQRIFGELAASDNGDLYRLINPTGCSDSFFVRAKSLDGGDVNIYIDDDVDASVSGYTGSAYDVQRDSTFGSESHRWNNTVDGTHHALLVKPNGSDTRYYLSYVVSCGGGSDDDDLALEKPLISLVQ